MQFCKKTIILKDIDDKVSEKKMLTLECQDGSIKGIIKTFGEVKKESLSLTISINDKILKSINLQSQGTSEVNFKFSENLTASDNVYAAVTSETNEKTIFIGSSGQPDKKVIQNLLIKISGGEPQSQSENDENLIFQNEKFISVPDKNLQEKNIDEKLDDEKTNCISDADNDNEKLEDQKQNKSFEKKDYNSIEDSDHCDNSTDPIHEEVEENADENPQLQIPIDRNICEDKVTSESFGQKIKKMQDELEQEGESDFYALVKEQVLEMFSTYPQSNILTSQIKNSKWVKVDFLGDNTYYLLGIIKEDGIVKQIAYAVPTSDPHNPPVDIKSYCTFVPLTEGDAQLVEDENIQGFFVMLQNAKTGEKDNLILD